MTSDRRDRPVANAIMDFLIGSRMPPRETMALHAAIQVSVEARRPSVEIDALLAQCKTDECAMCGSIVCPHGEPLHFHHDGCPACDGGVHE